MARKELGHIELQWTCPNCNGINPGPEKHCLNCGAPQPEDVEFEQADHQERKLHWQRLGWISTARTVDQGIQLEPKCATTVVGTWWKVKSGKVEG